jgi:hypothetical protein
MPLFKRTFLMNMTEELINRCTPARLVCYALATRSLINKEGEMVNPRV